MVSSQYLRDIISLLLDDDEHILLRKQADYIEEDNFEYTGSGVFVGFKHDKQRLNYRFDVAEIRLGGVLITSDEIDIGADASIIITDGLIDYLEIWSYGDVYPSGDPVHYTLEQKWKEEQHNKKIIR